MRILGISAFYHDSAAALIEDGVITAAAQEERFTRRRHDAAFPSKAIAYCLSQAGITLDEVDHIAFFEKPFVKFNRLLETYLANAPSGYSSFRLAMPVWIKEKLFQKSFLAKQLTALGSSAGVENKLLFASHHQSHIAAAFYPSPFDEAVILTLDGVGEWTTASVALGKGSKIDVQREIRWPHSLGLLYSAFTYYTGFKVNSGEYKVMGLAPYGEPRYADLILKHLIRVADDGSFWLDQSYFSYATGLTMTNSKFDALFGGPPRSAESELTQHHMDLAASVQHVIEFVMLRIVENLARCYSVPNLCLAGGVALNCVANGKILRSGYFKDIWIQPAAGDAGSAIGAALAAWHQHFDQPRMPQSSLDGMSGSYLGPSFEQTDIEMVLRELGAAFTVHEEAALLEKTAEALASGKAVGWFQGRMEFGPRALGARSILADPRNPGIQRTLNLRIKYRESFRPFAPSVLMEDVADYFQLKAASPYMLLVADVNKDRRVGMTPAQEALFGIEKLNVPRSDIPAVTHVDYSARVQTVHRETNPKYHALLTAFKQRTGCSVLVNTSFNIRGEPIVCTPEDAFRCFMGCDMDVLVVGNCILHKSEQDAGLRLDYMAKFALD